MEKQRAIFFLVLIVLGAGLLTYGLSSTAAPVPSARPSLLGGRSEPAAAQAAPPASDGLQASSPVQKKEAEPAKPPAACPT